MSWEHKLEVLRAVETPGLRVGETLAQLTIPRSTYYRWRRNFRYRGLASLRDRPSSRGRVWNQILPGERDQVLEVALLFPEWSSREVICYMTDACGFTISESSVFRILKAQGWIQPVPRKTFPAGPEYRIKTTRPNQQWQTDATHLLVKNWGWYHLISVLDDFSRGILAWGLQPAMRAGDFSQVVEAACETAGVEQGLRISGTGQAVDRQSSPFGQIQRIRNLCLVSCAFVVWESDFGNLRDLLATLWLLSCFHPWGLGQSLCHKNRSQESEQSCESRRQNRF